MKLSKQPVNLFDFIPLCFILFFYKLGKDGHHFVTGGETGYKSKLLTEAVDGVLDGTSCSGLISGPFLYPVTHLHEM